MGSTRNPGRGRGPVSRPNRQTVDPNRLAAFLDGTLSELERQEVMAVLASSPDAYEQFVETAAVLKDLAATQPAPSPLPRPRPVFSRMPRWAPVLLAATLAGIFFWARSLRTRAAPDTAALLALAPALGPASGSGSLRARLGNDWGAPGWSVNRGAGDNLNPDQRAFRLGARVADLEIAARIADPEAIRIAGAELQSLARAEVAGSVIAERYTAIIAGSASAAPAAAAERARAAADLHSLLQNSPWFDLGISDRARKARPARGRSRVLRRGRAAEHAAGAGEAGGQGRC